MVVQYHWGHGIGHTYSHQSQKIQKTNDADLEKDVQEMEVRQENLPQTSWSSPHTKGNGNNEAGDDSEELDMESYDEYDSEDDGYNYCDDEDSEEEDETSDDDIE